ncbi:MAG: hypothetical protein GC191_10540 [Azospirillum sp.]|nr:hypothetical protein [Azospirillum sp.]
MEMVRVTSRALRILAKFLGLAIIAASIAAPWAGAAERQAKFCGDNDQRACTDRDCVVLFSAFLFAFPYAYCPPQCQMGLTEIGGVCRPPAGVCDTACKVERIKLRLGKPSGLEPGKTYFCREDMWDPYNGRRVSRADLGLTDSDGGIFLDIGGEGLAQADGKQWGSNNSINLNCSLVRTTDGMFKIPIKHLIFGFGQKMPFEDHFADKIFISGTPIFPLELERVIRPGGLLEIVAVGSEMAMRTHQLMLDMCVSAPIDTWNLQRRVLIRVPRDFDYRHPRQATCTFK